MILLHVVIVLSTTILSIIATNIDTLETVIEDVGEESLKDGENLEDLNARVEKYLNKKGDVGIVLEIENYSELELDDPHLHLYAGEKDKK